MTDPIVIAKEITIDASRAPRERLIEAMHAAKLLLDTQLDAETRFKAAIAAVLQTLAPDDAFYIALTSEIDILFGATAAATGQPIDLATILQIFPHGRFPIGVLELWCHP